MRYTYTLMPKSGEGLILYNTASAAEGSFLTNCSIFLGMFSSSCSSCMEKPGEVATFNYNLLIFLEELRLGSITTVCFSSTGIDSMCPINGNAYFRMRTNSTVPLSYQDKWALPLEPS